MNPFPLWTNSQSIDHYVTNKSLETGKKIRADPAARTTDLLKTVFGK